MIRAEAGGWEAVIRDGADAFVRGIVEVVVGRWQQGGGVILDRMVPLAQSDGTIAWQRRIDMLGNTDGAVREEPADTVSIRLPREQAAAVGRALLAYAEGDQGEAPGDAYALRADLTFERGRSERMLDALIGVVERSTGPAEPAPTGPVAKHVHAYSGSLTSGPQ